MMTSGPHSTPDTLTNEAVDWLLRVNARPEDVEIRAGLAAWIAQSESHSKAYRKAQRVWQLTGDVPPFHANAWEPGPPSQPAADDPAPSRVIPLSALPAQRPRRATRRRLGIGLAGGAIAACIAALLASQVLLAMQADYVTDTGQTHQVTLADGTVGTLGGSSALAVNYSATERQVVLLRGEAYFRVTHDSHRPFSVRAAEMTARDIGTAFDVEIETHVLQVAVQSGSVAVTYDPGRSSLAATLTAGDRISIDRATGRASRGTESAGAVGTWQTGRMVVEDVSIDEVVQRLRRYFQGYIWVRDDALLNRRISGVYDLTDPVAALKAAVDPHAGIVTQVTPYLLVVSSR